MQTQMRLMEALSAHLTSLTPAAPAQNLTSVDHLAKSIPDFLFDPQAGVSFETWYKRYEDVFTVDLANRDDETKVRLLLRKLGPAEHVRYTNYILPDEPRSKSFTDTVTTLKKIFGDSCSLFNARFQCLQIVKRESDDFVTYAGLVNRECDRFQLGSLTADQFRCLIFLCGLKSPNDADLRMRLLALIDQDPTIKLQQIVDECERLRNLKHDSALIQQPNTDPQTIHAVSSPSIRSPPKTNRPKPSTSKKPPYPCRFCGAWHYHKFCQFRKHRCQLCHQQGHKEGFCKQDTPTQKAAPASAPKRRPLPRSKSASRLHSLIGSCKTNTTTRRMYVTVSINDKPARMQLDTASDITIISKKLWSSLGRPPLQPSNQTATSACGGSVELIGRLHCSVAFRGTTVEGICYVTDTGLNLLGLDWLEQLGLLDLPVRAICNQLQSTPSGFTKYLVEKFAPVFQEGLGLCSSTQVKLQLRAGSQPIFRPKRPVPYAAFPLVDQELKRLEQSGVLVPVSYSAWAAPIVVVKKANGSIRLCADFSTGLNAALEPNCYPLPLPEDIFTILNGGTCFAKLDLAEAYLQVEVAPESRELLTINTHRGLFQYTRLPFGVKTAPAMFQQLIDTVISGLAGTAAYLDDIIIMGRTTEELKDRLIAVLQRIQDHGLRLRPEKCQFFMRKIKYLGFVFDAEGRHPDPENIRAIQEMPPPTDVTTLRSFLGLINYYGSFLPALHDIRAPLNRLLQKDTTWVWSKDCQDAFSRLKTLLKSKLLLTHFDPSLPIIVAADASNYGVGAVISHTFPDGSEKPIAHASRTLTPSEKNYGQIEKEALAIVFAVKKFHKFLWGRHFTLLTDHKPLLSIFGSKKGIPVYSANRLQRWATILLGYDFTIQYRRTNEFGQADGLSRLICNHRAPEEDVVIAAMCVEDDVRRQLSDAIRGLPVTAADIRRATQLDPILRQAIAYTQTSWPNKNFTGDLRHLSCRRDSLSVVNSCLMFADRVVVPATLRLAVLRQFHSGHPGISRMKAIARGYAYWPGMDRDIEDWVKKCSRCQHAAKSPPRQEPIPWELPRGPWSRLHIDFAGPLDGLYYFVLVDAFSRWPEVVPLSHATSTSTISTLRRIFSVHGVPEVIVSDNGTQFTSSLFKDFCRALNIQHIHSPPYHPQSNGQAERFVDTFKRALLKSRGEGPMEEVLQTFLFTYRTTPNPATPDGRSPAEVLMGRQLRTINHGLLPRDQPNHEPAQKPTHGAFPVGALVYARDYRQGKDNWTEATITGRRGKVTYEVTVGSEKWIRHRNQLRPRHLQTTTTSTETPLPLGILLDTFSLPTPAASEPHTATESEGNHRPRRFPSRVRKQTTRFQINPRKPSYR